MEGNVKRGPGRPKGSKTKVKLASKKVEAKKPVGRPVKTEKDAFEKCCEKWGFKPWHYQMPAYIWSNKEDDYVEAKLTGFTVSGKAVFTYLTKSSLESKMTTSIKNAALNLKEYLVDSWYMMDNGTVKRNEDSLSSIRSGIKEMDAVLESVGYKGAKPLSMSEVANFYGSYENARFCIPKAM